LEYLAQHIESLIFTTEHPIGLEEIQSCLEETFETPFEAEELEKALEDLKSRYKEEHFAFELVEIANGFQFLTKGAYHQTVGTYLKQTTKRRLSRAAIETLSITAYKQPISKSELEKIRGVSCDYSIQKLLEKELVTILGRADSPGRPLLYGTTERFMDYFGIKSLKDLPKPKDFKEPDSEVGEAAPIEEEISTNGEEAGSSNSDVEMESEHGFNVADGIAGIAAIEAIGSEHKTEEKEAIDQEITEALEANPNDGISNADISIESLDDTFEQEEQE